MLQSFINSKAKEGPGTLLKIASRMGVLPQWADSVISGLACAPEPTLTTFSKDWLNNLDVMSHGLGCMSCGVFDSLVEGLTSEEISMVTWDMVRDQYPPLIADFASAPVLFDLCKQLYLEYGSLSRAAASGKFKPEGIVGQVIVSNLANRRKESSFDLRAKLQGTSKPSQTDTGRIVV